MLSRKHYQAVANIIKCDRDLATVSIDYRNALDGVAHRMADHFASDNPAFNRDKFLAACGIKS